MSDDTENVQSETTRRDIRGSSLLLAGRLVSKITNFGIQVLIIRALTRDSYGAFAYALSLVTLGQVLVTFGMDKALPRFLPIYLEQGETRRFYGALRVCAGVVFVLSALLIPALFLAAPWLDGTAIRSHEALRLLLILVFLVPLQAADQVLLGLLAIFGEAKKIFLRRHVITPILKVSFIGLAIAAGWSIEALSYAYMAATALGVAVTVILLIRVAREEGLSPIAARKDVELPLREIMLFTFPVLTSELIRVSVNTMDAVMLEQFHGTAEVAGLRAVQKVAVLNQLVMHSFTALFLPAASRCFARRDIRGLNETYWQTALWIAVLTFPVFALSFACSESVVSFAYGARYRDAAILLSLLSVGYYADALLGFNALTLKVYQRLRYILLINAATAVFALAANFALIPKFGAQGAAAGTMCTLILLATLKHIGLWRHTDVAPFRRGYVRVYALIVLFAAGLFVFNRVLAPSLWANLVLTALLTLLLLLFSRKQMRIGSTFPELRRIPILGPLLAR